MLRVTFDTNVYISALNFKGKPFELLELARDGAIEVSISEPIITELKRVLHDKFKWPDEDVAFVEKQIRSFTRTVEPKQQVDAVKEDPTDNRILECAVAGAADYIVTGDNHLLKLGQFAGARIIKPTEFLDIQAPGRGR